MAAPSEGRDRQVIQTVGGAPGVFVLPKAFQRLLEGPFLQVKIASCNAAKLSTSSAYASPCMEYSEMNTLIDAANPSGMQNY